MGHFNSLIWFLFHFPDLHWPAVGMKLLTCSKFRPKVDSASWDFSSDVPPYCYALLYTFVAGLVRAVLKVFRFRFVSPHSRMRRRPGS